MMNEASDNQKQLAEKGRFGGLLKKAAVEQLIQKVVTPKGSQMKDSIFDESKEVDDGVESLFERDGPRYFIRFELQNNGRELRGFLKPKEISRFISLDEILKHFEHMGVKAPVDVERVRAFCDQACSGKEQYNVLLVEAVPCKPGTDEFVEFLVQPTTSKLSLVENDSGGVSYRDLSLFENVWPDQKIARVIPPQIGKDGMAVMGERIIGDDGKKLEQKVKAGKNVRMDDYGRTFYATIAGRVEYDEVNNTISVLDEYVVDGDVGVATGDIYFVGSVEVKGDVTTGYSLKADKGVVVRGNVEGASIETGGDLSIYGGVSGGRKARIICGGTLKTRYVDDATVECCGDVLVKNEIVNSYVHCGGILKVLSGPIVGGECGALKAIEAFELGSVAGVKTHLTSGICYTSYRKIEALRNEVTKANDQIRLISDKIDPLLRNPKLMLDLNPTQKEAVKKLATKLKELMNDQETRQTQIDAIRIESRKLANPLISARQALFHGVILTLVSTTEVVQSDIHRPLTVVRNPIRGGVWFVKWRPATTNAKTIEQEMIDIEQKQEAW